jgi:hypothetical protein
VCSSGIIRWRSGIDSRRRCRERWTRAVRSETEPRHDLPRSWLRSIAWYLARQRNIERVDNSKAGAQNTVGLDRRCRGIGAARLRGLADTRRAALVRGLPNQSSKLPVVPRKPWAACLINCRISALPPRTSTHCHTSQAIGAIGGCLADRDCRRFEASKQKPLAPPRSTDADSECRCSATRPPGIQTVAG